MKKISIALVLFVSLLLTGCQYVTFGPVDVLPGTYARIIGYDTSGNATYDYMFVIGAGTTRVVDTAHGIDVEYESSYTYSSFDFDTASGSLVINGYGTFTFMMNRYSNGAATLVLINSAGERISLIKGASA